MQNQIKNGTIDTTNSSTETKNEKANSSKLLMKQNNENTEVIIDKMEYMQHNSLISYEDWKSLINFPKYQMYQKVFNYYKDYTYSSLLNQSYQEYLLKYEFDIRSLATESIESQIQNFQNKYKFASNNLLAKIVLKKLLNQEILSYNYFEKIQICEDECFNSKAYKLKKNYLFITESFIFSDTSNSSNVCLDKNFNFVLKKQFLQSLNKTIINKEKEILRSQYSDFIVQSVDENDENLIVIPYFPLGNLSYIFQNGKKDTFQFNLFEKIVIILEIAIALYDLHMNNQYHGFLSDDFIYISSTKDSYIGSFSYDQSKENNATKYKGPAYYRNTNKNEINRIEDDSNDNLQKKQEDDIYSFGVLAHEIFTETKPYSRMNKKPRNERINIISGDYCTFLFQGKNNECFNDDNMIDFKNIIIKCMNKDRSDQKKYFHSMSEVIESIKNSIFYQQYKDEFDMRLKNAIKSSEYKCTIADIVLSYYEGQSNSKKIINTFLKTYKDNFSDLKQSDDIIQTILQTLDIKKKDLSFHFHDIFDYIIGNYYCKKLDKKRCIDLNDKLLTFSIDENNNAWTRCDSNKGLISEFECNIIPPISSLKDFLNNNMQLNEEKSLIWAYSLAKEITLMISKNIFIDNLSYESIGIYYNKITKTFIPSIILYNYYYKNTCLNSNLQQKRKRNQLSNEYKIIRKYKKLIKTFGGISTKLLNIIDKSDSMNVITFYIYNFIQNQSNEVIKSFNNNYLNSDYSLFKFSFSEIHDIIKIIKEKNYNESVFTNIELIVQEINEFIDLCISNPESTIKNLISNIETKNKMNQQNLDDITNIITHIKQKSTSIIDSILDENDKDENINMTNIIIQEGNKLIYNGKPRQTEKVKHARNESFKEIIPFKISKQKRKWFNKSIVRKLEICELCFGSFEFIMRRYLLSLNPNLKFRLQVKISNRIYSKYQDAAIKAEDVIKIANESGFDAVVEDGIVIITSKTKKNKIL